nr:hypothetical protein [Tanacetum cinerariifolium]
SHGCEGFLATIHDTTSNVPSIHDQLIVSEFPDVFPDELPGIPPVRERGVSRPHCFSRRDYYGSSEGRGGDYPRSGWLDIELYVRGQHGYWASRRVEPDLISQIK